MISKTHTKYIQSLHLKKFRDANDVFIAEGNKVVPELLQSGKFDCIELYGTREWLHENEISIRKNFSGLLQDVEEFELEKISCLSTPNQCLAVFKKSKEAKINPVNKITLMLDTIQDPGNLGTIIRIADWFGVNGIVCSENCADRYNPKVVQSTMGSLGRVDFLYTNLIEWLDTYPAISKYAAALNGKKINDLNSIKEAVIIIGNESKGISDEILKKANEKITIPKTGEAESLNAAVATGIILSHICI